MKKLEINKVSFFILSFFLLFGLNSIAYSQTSSCQDGECVSGIVDRLEDLGSLYTKECLPSEGSKISVQAFHEKNGLSEKCWKLITEIGQLKSELTNHKSKLELRLGCETGECRLPGADESLNSQLNEISKVAQSLSCTEPKKAAIRAQCPRDLNCALAASALGVGGYLAEMMLPEKSKMNGCNLGEDSCVTQLATSFLKSVTSFFEGSWDLLKVVGRSAGNKMEKFWSWVKDGEDHSSTSQLTMARASEDPGVFNMLVNDFPGTMKKVWAAFAGAMKEWLKGDVFCQEWTGAPHISKCSKPMESFDCIPCKNMINGLCSVSGTIVAEIVPAFLTGGLSSAAKYGVEGSAKIAKLFKVSESSLQVIKNSRIAKVALEATTKADDALRVSRTLRATTATVNFALGEIGKYLLSPTTKKLDESLLILKEAMKKGTSYVAETRAGKVIVFSGKAAKMSGNIIIYPIENPMTTFAFKAGQRSFEKLFKLGAPKLGAQEVVATTLIKNESKIENLLANVEEAKIKNQKASDLLKLEEELLAKIEPKRRELLTEALKEKEVKFDEIIKELYPELQYGDLAKKLGSKKIIDSEKELLLHLEAMPSGEVKEALLKRYQAHVMHGEARAKVVGESLVKTESSVGLIASLEDASFAQDKFTKNILESFKEKGSSEASLLVLKKTKAEIIEELKSFKFKNSSGVTLEMKPDVFVGTAHGSSEEVLNLAGAFHAEGSEKPIGFFVLSFPKGESGKIQPYLEMIKVDTSKPEIKGLAAKLIPSISEHLQKSGYSRLDLEADWMGRLVWAKNGFDFDSDIMFLRGGEKISQLDLARENLKRFLDAHNLKITDLEIKSASGNRAVSSVEDLKTPLDFIDLIHSEGKKITIRPYVGEGVFEEASEQSVGSAFALTDYSPRKDQSVKIIGADGDPLSDQALFNWQGVLRLHP